jgi:hypothetical protein
MEGVAGRVVAGSEGISQFGDSTSYWQPRKPFPTHQQISVKRFLSISEVTTNANKKGERKDVVN